MMPGGLHEHAPPLCAYEVADQRYGRHDKKPQLIGRMPGLEQEIPFVLSLGYLYAPQRKEYEKESNTKDQQVLGNGFEP
jgi:hypothetical protein